MNTRLAIGSSPRDWWNWIRTRPIRYEAFEKVGSDVLNSPDFATQLAKSHKGAPFLKWEHYFPVYSKVARELKAANTAKVLKILEIGVDRGGSLVLWKKLFGNGNLVYGIDINPMASQVSPRIAHVRIGSQNDQNFLDEIKKEIGSCDLIVDDGSHASSDVIFTFKSLFPWLAAGGIYLIEDSHSSYWTYWNLKGGLRRKTSCIEYFKNIIDTLHQDYIKSNASKRIWRGQVPAQIESIEFFDSIIIVRKAKETSGVSHARLVEAGYDEASKD